MTGVLATASITISAGPTEVWAALTHFSPMSGGEDVPENYHHLTYTLTATGSGTQVELTQDNNPDEASAGMPRCWDRTRSAPSRG